MNSTRKVLIYDESCPMCRLYTKGMVAADATLGRISSGQLTDAQLLSRVDRQRAKHEIPLIDLDGGETLYGVDTWTYAFGRHRFGRLLALKWVQTGLRALYAFISYNRRIIITSAPGRWQLLDLQPDFRLGYRLPFVLMIFGLTAVLFEAINGSAGLVAGLMGCQLLLVSLFLVVTHPGNYLETLLDYAGHLGLSLAVGGLISKLGMAAGLPQLVVAGYALAIGQHFIRVYRLGLNPWLSVCFTGLLLMLSPFYITGFVGVGR